MKRLLLLITLGLLEASCTCAPLAVDASQYQCLRDDECGSGFRCVNKVCVTPDSVDSGAPPFDGGPVHLDAGCAPASCSGPGKSCGTDGGPCVCSGNGGLSQPSEGSCIDGFDNDCDGEVDCGDTDCAGSVCDAAAPMTCQGTRCLCAPDAGVLGELETNCGNRKDDNCNALVDCEESSCSGQACSTTGRICMGSECTCFVAQGTVEVAEVTCNDAKDNDCDGQLDCADATCGGQACGADGRVCVGASCECGGNGGTPQPIERICSDGFDNDCDTMVDCQDAQCNGESCSANSKSCIGGLCTCTANGGVVQGSETLCADGKDNDCDGFTDCADSSCAGEFCGGATKTCIANSCQCTVAGGTPEVAESMCGDGKDNDCDGETDCADSKCVDKLCAANGLVCSGNACTCTGDGGKLETIEASCNDGKDNDCNGYVDCEDSACANQKCSQHGMCCAGRGCVDTSSTSDCGGCGLNCAAAQRCVIVNATESGYQCSCSATATTCPAGVGGSAQLCNNSFCECTPSLNVPSNQCAAQQPCAPGKFCTFKK